MTTDKDIFLRQRFESEVEIWDVAESEVTAPTFTLEVDKYNDFTPKDTKKGGFVYYPNGSELPKEYQLWYEKQFPKDLENLDIKK